MNRTESAATAPRRLAALSAALLAALLSGRAAAAELLADPGFENTSPMGTDPWRLVFFTPAPVSTNATVSPAAGLEHASVTKDHSLPNLDPQIASAVFAGFGGAASISDFRGLSLDLSVQYKVNENTVVSGGTPGTFVRMFLSYFGSSGFLGFGSFASSDVFVESTNATYETLAFSDVVPNFGAPVTSVDLNLAVLGQGGGTGAATVFFDNASMQLVPEPSTSALAALVAAVAGACRRSRQRRWAATA
jgi:hypothetical protein